MDRWFDRSGTPAKEWVPELGSLRCPVSNAMSSKSNVLQDADIAPVLERCKDLRVSGRVWHIWKGARRSQCLFTQTGRIGGNDLVLMFMPGMGKASTTGLKVLVFFRSGFPHIWPGLVMRICGVCWFETNVKEETILEMPFSIWG